MVNPLLKTNEEWREGGGGGGGGGGRDKERQKALESSYSMIE